MASLFFRAVPKTQCSVNSVNIPLIHIIIALFSLRLVITTDVSISARSTNVINKHKDQNILILVYAFLVCMECCTCVMIV